MRPLLALVLVACTHPASPPVEIAESHRTCLAYGYGGLPMYMPPSHQTDAPIVHAHDDATAHFAAATDATDPDVATREFLACARAYRAIPDDDPQRALATKSIDVCVGNALSAAANGHHAARGREGVEALVQEDPRLRAIVDARLVHAPTDCP